MKLSLTHTIADVHLVRDFCSMSRGKKLVKFRHSKNLSTKKPGVDEARFWRALVCMRLTSRQKSGPNSAVARLVSMKPFPLSIGRVRAERGNVQALIASELKAIGGMRDYEVAARQLATNLQVLENGGWVKFLRLCNDLGPYSPVSHERSAANCIQANFKGFGPKQSRNFLQALGLTKYEIPLDSRVMKWLREQLCFPLPINGIVLADNTYYEFVLDKLQELCSDAGVFPCILDAAIFAAEDDDSWARRMMDF